METNLHYSTSKYPRRVVILTPIYTEPTYCSFLIQKKNTREAKDRTFQSAKDGKRKIFYYQRSLGKFYTLPSYYSRYLQQGVPTGLWFRPFLRELIKKGHRAERAYTRPAFLKGR